MDFKQLHKSELHLHLDGAISVDFVYNTITSQKIVLEKYWSASDLEQGKVTKPFLTKILFARTDTVDLIEYLKAFDITCACMQTADNLRAAVADVSAYLKENNIKHAELRYAPVFHTSNLAIEEVQNIVADACHKVELSLNISITVIICTMKLFPADSEMTKSTHKLYRNSYPVTIAYDQAGPETMFQPTHYLDQMKQLTVPITLHAGEAGGPDHVKEAVECGAIRIGHGVRSYEDPAVLALLKEKKIVLEMCPTSNTQTNVFGISKTLEDYPLKKYLDYGIRCCINTDNPMISQCSISSELQLISNKLKLDAAEILMVVDFGFEGAFMEPEKKKTERKMAFDHNVEYLKKFDAAIVEKYNEKMEKFV